MSQDPIDEQNPLNETDAKHTDLKETVSAQSPEDTRGTAAFQGEGTVQVEEKLVSSQDATETPTPSPTAMPTAEASSFEAYNKVWTRLNDHLTEVEGNMLVNVSDHSKILYYALWVSQSNAIFRRLGTLRKRRANIHSTICG